MGDVPLKLGRRIGRGGWQGRREEEGKEQVGKAKWAGKKRDD